MNIVVSGITIEVYRKEIKNLHLQIKPPDGHVVISAPIAINDSAIAAFARINLSFIKKSIQQFQNQDRLSIRQYISGETLYIFGVQYYVDFRPSKYRNVFEIKNRTIMLSMKEQSTVKQRDAFVKENLRKLLKSEIEKRLPKWEKITGLKCKSWQTKYMTTKWGTCSVDKKKLWFNLQLAQKPLICLEYIILHELTHLITRKHDDKFIAHMDKYMPNWRDIKKQLNDSMLDYYEVREKNNT